MSETTASNNVTAEIFYIAPRESTHLNQHQQLANLATVRPELLPVMNFIEKDERFAEKVAKLCIIQDCIPLAFMKGEVGPLHGVFVIQDMRVQKRFDRLDLRLEPSEESDIAMEAHLPYLAKAD